MEKFAGDFPSDYVFISEEFRYQNGYQNYNQQEEERYVFLSSQSK
ncbi:MAG: hypothetical protein AB9882_05825 [Ignavibacteriaceae bacterium]